MMVDILIACLTDWPRTDCRRFIDLWKRSNKLTPTWIQSLSLSLFLCVYLFLTNSPPLSVFCNSIVCLLGGCWSWININFIFNKSSLQTEPLPCSLSLSAKLARMSPTMLFSEQPWAFSHTGTGLEGANPRSLYSHFQIRKTVYV